MKGISVVIPAYNEEGNIEAVVRRSLGALKKLASNYEVLVVNDGSTDKTGEILKRLANEDKNVRVLLHERNMGVGAGLKDLWKNARYDFVIDLPGDSQQDPAEIGKFLSLIENADVVCGYRLKRVDAAHRTWFKNLYHLILRVLFGVNVRDIDWVKMYRKGVLDRMRLTSNSAFVIAEAVIRAKRAGCRIAEVGVTHHPRIYGRQTGAKPKVMVKQLADVFKFWFALNFMGA